MKEKIKTVYWYLKNGYLMHFLSLLKRKIYNNDNKDKVKAEAWCEGKLKTLPEVLAKFNIEYHSFKVDNADIYTEAKKKAISCPVEMGGSGNMDLLYSITLNNKINNVIETGVAYGWSSLVILTAFIEKKDGRLISVDMPYAKLNNEPYVGIVVPERLRKKWVLIRKSDRKGLPLALEKAGSIDMCHYDSDKSYLGRSWAYPRLWKALKKGGFFISDDIQDNLAFKEFVETMKLDSKIVLDSDRYVGIIVK